MMRKGQSILEFALVFPLIFLLITGLVDLGRALFYYSTLNNAVREGTRYAIVQPKGTEDSVIEDKVAKYFYDINDLQTNVAITVNHTGTSEDPKIQIIAAYIFKPITPGLKQIYFAALAGLVCRGGGWHV